MILQLLWPDLLSCGADSITSPPLSKPIGEGLFEMRHVGKLNTRVLYFFAKGQRIIAVHGIRSKAQKISERDIKVALERKKDWWLREA